MVSGKIVWSRAWNMEDVYSSTRAEDMVADVLVWHSASSEDIPDVVKNIVELQDLRAGKTSGIMQLRHFFYRWVYHA